MKVSEIKWIFFDLGSTLVNEEKAFQDRINRMSVALNGFGIRVSPDRLWSDFEQAAVDFSPRYVLTVLSKYCSNDRIREYVGEHSVYNPDFEKLYPQSVEIVEKLTAHYQIGIIANQSPGTKERLKRFGLWKWISLLISSDEVKISKPDPAIFQLALAQADCSARQAVMIGDRLDHDIRPAKELGWNTIRVLQGFARNQQPRDDSELADITIDDLSDIRNILFH